MCFPPVSHLLVPTPSLEGILAKKVDECQQSMTVIRAQLLAFGGIVQRVAIVQEEKEKLREELLRERAEKKALEEARQQILKIIREGAD